MTAVDLSEQMAPNYKLYVEGSALTANVTQFIEKVEYESADGIADVLKVSVMDPDFFISKRKLFLPGNELSLSFGYGPKIAHVGRAVITNVREQFPLDGMPVIDISAYTRDHLMQEVRPDPDPPEKSKKRGRKKKKKAKVVWGRAPISDVVSAIAQGWGFTPDVDPLPAPPRTLTQPMKMSDFDFVRGLANFTGSHFWVDGDERGQWTLHFKTTANLLKLQKKIYTFKYNNGDLTTLLNFEPEMVYKGHFTKIQAQTTTTSGKVVKVSFVEQEDQSWSTKPGKEDEEVEGAMGTAQSVQLFVGDYSFRAVAPPALKDRASLQAWAEEWFKRHRQDFIIGRGTLIGLEELFARQEHKIEGVGPLYDGTWHFTRVRHILDASSGYTSEFDARKVQ